jgi:hypothetical protein
VDAVGTGAVKTSGVGAAALVAACGAAAAGVGTVEVGVGVLDPPPHAVAIAAIRSTKPDAKKRLPENFALCNTLPPLP